MTCQPAKVAERAWHDDRTRYGNRVTFLGIVASPGHAADCHQSGHNCAETCGGQESPVNGKRYDPRYAYALDTGVDSPALGYEIVNAYVRDPRVRYCIFRGVGYYGHAYRPPRADGSTRTFRASGHPNHVHRSFLPGTENDTRPFYQGTPDEEFDMAAVDEIKNAVFVMGVKVLTELAETEERLLRAEWKTRRLIKDSEATDEALTKAVKVITDRLAKQTASLKDELGVT